MLLPYKPKRKNTKEEERLKTKSVFNITGGIDISMPPMMIEDRFLSNCKNVIFEDGKIKNRPGYSTFGSNLPLDSKIMGIEHLFNYDGTEYLVAYTLDKAYAYNSTLGTWLDVTDTAGDYTGGAEDEFYTETIYDDNSAGLLYISTNRTDAVKKWTGTGKFDDLAGSPNKCKFLKNFNHHLMLFDVVVTGTRFPQRIDWSDAGLPETWTGGASGNVHLVKNEDYLIGAELIRGQLAIFKENSITMGTYVGGTSPFIFEENKITGIGCGAGKTLLSLGDRLIFLGDDNVYSFDGFQAIPISDRIQKKLFDNLNLSKIHVSHSMLLPKELGLYLLFVPSTSSDQADTIWVWDYRNDSWSYWEFYNDILTTGYYESSTSTKIGELLGKIGTFTWKIGSQISESSFSLMGDDGGYIYKLSDEDLLDNDNAIPYKIESKSYILSNLKKFSRAVSVDIYGKGDALDLYSSKNDGIDYSFENSAILDSTESGASIVKLENTSEKTMLKLESSTLSNFFEIDGWNISFTEKGMKKKNEYLEEILLTDGSVVYSLDISGEETRAYIRS